MSDEPIEALKDQLQASREEGDILAMQRDQADAEVARLTEVVRDVMMTARDARIPDEAALLRIADIAAHALLVQEAEEGNRG